MPLNTKKETAAQYVVGGKYK